ncbi:MAG: hypothetical protein J7L11_07230 [Thermoprotei archaeon]|nr:hypothetical protein [Thermoprotei archaeon]
MLSLLLVLLLLQITANVLGGTDAHIVDVLGPEKLIACHPAEYRLVINASRTSGVQEAELYVYVNDSLLRVYDIGPLSGIASYTVVVNISRPGFYDLRFIIKHEGSQLCEASRLVEACVNSSLKVTMPRKFSEGMTIMANLSLTSSIPVNATLSAYLDKELLFSRSLSISKEAELSLPLKITKSGLHKMIFVLMVPHEYAIEDNVVEYDVEVISSHISAERLALATLLVLGMMILTYLLTRRRHT